MKPPIPIEKLLSTRVIVSHRAGPDSACPDGTAAAILASDVLPDAKVRFVHHGKGEGSVSDLVAESGMLFVDMTPPANFVDAFVKAGAIVLDHHDKQRDLVERFEEDGSEGVPLERLRAYGFFGLNERVESGAWLAFSHVWLPLEKHRAPEPQHDPDLASCSGIGIARARAFARLAAVRDTWQPASPERWQADAQSLALRHHPWEQWASIDDPFGDGYQKLSLLLDTGPHLLKQHKARAERLAKEAHVMHVNDLRVAVIPTLETSDAADYSTADILAGFAYRHGPKGDRSLVISLRSRGKIDVGAIAKANGGGGHTHAAGCEIPIQRVTNSPYGMIAILIANALQQ